MAETSIFTTTVARLCRVSAGRDRDVVPPLDAEGFLDDTAVEAYSATGLTPGALVPTSALVVVRALVLLGEPGIGKSTEFARLTADLSHGDDPSGRPEVLLVDGAGLSDQTFGEELGDRLRALPAAGGAETEIVDPTNDPASLTVVIDQLDDSPMVRRLAPRLQAVLRGRDTSRLRFILGCRTADYPDELTRLLADACGECIVVDLAPLTRRDAVELASSVDGVDGETLIAAAVDAGAAALANAPLTLDLLVRAYLTAGALTGGSVELFGQGVQLLADDPDPDRYEFGDSTVQQRLAVAERIAARLLLSGRRTIWVGQALGAGEQDYLAEFMAHGEETCATGTFEVTPHLVKATLSTALFTGRGQSRRGFAHGSFAAYLAARYMVRRRVPKAQLERLFLVAGADETRSVPTSLREAAAWLVTLDPQHAQWLAMADPESLLAHSAIVDNPTVRQLVVEALLRRADEIELGNLPWTRTPRQLAHPGLALQLGDVLAVAETPEPEDWPATARVRLAVRLARESRVVQLAEPLLALAADEQWDTYTRLLAARTAFETAPDLAAPRLRQILADFTDISLADRVDPDGELRGALLDMLWPHHITVEEVLPHLRPRRNSNFIGSYRLFQHAFTSRLAEGDVNAVLQWARTNNGDPAEERPVLTTEDPSTTSSTASRGRPVGQMDAELIESILDRALTGSGAANRVTEAAAVVWPLLIALDHPPFPRALDLVTDTSQEPAGLRDLRRAFAHALIELSVSGGADTRLDTWAIVDAWGPPSLGSTSPPSDPSLQPAGRRILLDRDDFSWVYRATSDALAVGNSSLANAWARVAGYLFDLSHGESAELAYSDQDHPVWNQVRFWFEPMSMDCEHATRWRRTHSHGPTEAQDEQANLQTTQLAARLENLLDAAAAGDIDAYWRFVWNLQLEPSTGSGVHRFDDDLRTFPAVGILEPDYLDRLTRASVVFVATADDHSDEWLGTNRYDKRAWAGYLAIALLHRLDRLSEVPDDAWSSWAGAMVWFDATAVDTGDRNLKTALLEIAARHTPRRLADAAAVYARGALARGALASEVELIDPGWHPDIAGTWHTLLGEIRDAMNPPVTTQTTDQLPDDDQSTAADAASSVASPPETVELPTAESRDNAARLWETLVAALLAAGDRRGSVAALAAINDADGTLAARAVSQLLHHDAAAYLPKLLPGLLENAALGHDVAIQCATSYDRRDIMTQLDEPQLGALYEWLCGLFPPETDVQVPGAHFISPDEQARSWRDRLLGELAERGTDNAIRTLLRLRERTPDRIILTSYLVRARTKYHGTAWRPPEPEDLISLLADNRRRLVRSDDELAALLIESLQAVEKDLPTHGDLLWDRLPKDNLPNGVSGEAAWRPKLEHALSGYIAHELGIRLERHGLAVNREVLIKPTSARTGAGHRTDILVQANAVRDNVDSLTTDRFLVVIEVKGPWNDDLLAAQQKQLAETYLPEANTKVGIYLVGWWPPEQWTVHDDRRTRVAVLRQADLLNDLTTQAAHIQTELTVTTIPILIEIPRPHRDGETTAT